MTAASSNEEIRLKRELHEEIETNRQLEKDICVMVKGRNSEITDLSNTIHSLEIKVTKAEEERDSLKLALSMMQDKNYAQSEFNNIITEPVFMNITPEQTNQNKKPIPCSDEHIPLHVINPQQGINDDHKREKSIVDQLREYRHRKDEAYLMQKLLEISKHEWQVSRCH